MRIPFRQEFIISHCISEDPSLGITVIKVLSEMISENTDRLIMPRNVEIVAWPRILASSSLSCWLIVVWDHYTLKILNGLLPNHISPENNDISWKTNDAGLTCTVCNLVSFQLLCKKIEMGLS